MLHCVPRRTLLRRARILMCWNTSFTSIVARLGKVGVRLLQKGFLLFARPAQDDAMPAQSLCSTSMTRYLRRYEYIKELDKQRGRGQQGAKSPLLWDAGQVLARALMHVYVRALNPQ